MSGAQRRRFSPAIVAAIDRGKILGIRAGSAPHRIIGIWTVVVAGRVYVRSWGVTKGGWYAAWRGDPVGIMTVPGRKRSVPVRATPVRSERVKRAVTEAYVAKYRTPGSLEYVRDLARKKCRDATLELTPARAEPPPGA